MAWLIGALVGLAGLIAVWGLVTVLLQDVKILPALLIERKGNPVIPNSVCRTSLPTEDGVLIDIWESAPEGQEGFRAPPILFNHGNGHTNALFWSCQSRFRALGFHTYGYDYRGVAYSTGWPSERGIETDAAAILTMIAEKHGISPSEVIVMGVSLGTGPACYLAEKFKTRRLILYTPYLSLPELVRSMAGVGVLAPFVWYKFPNRARLIKWFIRPDESREVIVAHGKNDVVIPFSHGETIVKELQRHCSPGLEVSKVVQFVAPSSAPHEEIVELTWNEVSVEVQKWAGVTGTDSP